MPAGFFSRQRWPSSYKDALGPRFVHAAVGSSSWCIWPRPIDLLRLSYKLYQFPWFCRHFEFYYRQARLLSVCLLSWTKTPCMPACQGLLCYAPIYNSIALDQWDQLGDVSVAEVLVFLWKLLLHPHPRAAIRVWTRRTVRPPLKKRPPIASVGKFIMPSQDSSP